MSTDTRNRFEICPAADLEPGDRMIVEVDGISMGIFNLDGEFYALNNVCPHQLAPLCDGMITGTTTSSTPGEYEEWVKDGEIVRCPWHGWEFDIKSGESLFNPHVRTRTFEATVEERDAGADDADAGADTNAVSAADSDAGPACAAAGGTDESSDQQRQKEEFGTALAGDEPPVETYEVEVEREMLVVYL